LSNFYPCEFTDNEELNNSGNQIVFKNMEQYFMYQKAKMFDKDMIKQILDEIDPKKIQGYGKQVKNFSDEEWDKHKLNIMYRGLELKFGQNREILDELLETKNKNLYEANKYDRYWGIGCDDKTAIKIEKGNVVRDKNENVITFGKNMLGELLMKLRKSFSASNNNSE